MSEMQEHYPPPPVVDAERHSGAFIDVAGTAYRGVTIREGSDTADVVLAVFNEAQDLFLMGCRAVTLDQLCLLGRSETVAVTGWAGAVRTYDVDRADRLACAAAWWPRA